MFVRPLKAGPDIGVTLGALLVHFRRFARHQTVGSVLVDGMARRAAHLIFGMTALNASYVRGLIQMTGETELVRGGGLQFGRLDNVAGAHGFRVLASGPMARFASFGLEPAFLASLDRLVGVLLERVECVLVASLAGCGADVLGRFIIGRSFSGGGRFFLRAPCCGEGEGDGRRQHRQ